MSATYSEAAVDKIFHALTTIIADQDQEIAQLKEASHGDASCEIINRQVSALFKYLVGRRAVYSRDVEKFFLVDPADVQGEDGK